MDSIAADTRYTAYYRSTWALPDGGDTVIGHLVIRRLDDDVVVAEVAATNDAEARALTERAETDLMGLAHVFEERWGLEQVDVPPVPVMLPPEHVRRGSVRESRRGEAIHPGDPRIHVLPDPADVFAPQQPWLSRVLQAPVSVTLAAINPAWIGCLPILSPVEPIDGLLGEQTGSHHDEHAGVNWISFHLDEADRVAFLGRREFFSIEGHLQAHTPVPPDLRRHYERAEQEFADSAARWRRYGLLTRGSQSDPTRPRDGWMPAAVVDRLGGDAGYGNWVSFPPPSAFRLDDTDPGTPRLRLADGRECVFVCATAGHLWREQAADAILVFFEPETRTVIMTYDWA